MNDSDKVKQLFDYDPKTGVLRWRVSRRGKTTPGQVAGNIQGNGYRYVPFCGRLIGAHRVIWLYVNGVWPTGDIDHINRDRGDNRIENLRDVTRSQNMRNSIRKRTNASPYQGVCFDKASGKWMASITTNYKQMHLGRYDTAEEAHNAYVKASKEIHGAYSAF